MDDGLNVFVVDDQPAVLRALERLLGAAGYRVRGFGSAAEFFASGLELQHGCLVTDLSMPDMDGLGLQRALAARGSSLQLIFITGLGDIESSVRAMKSGAVDFLTKPVDDERLLSAVEIALARSGEAYLRSAQQQELVQRLALLTPRETDVLRIVLQGRLNKQIASELGIAEKTIKVHRARIMAKMQARSVAELVRMVEPHRTLI